MGSLRQDLRHGLRILFRSPGFASVTVISLALGIGANTAIFSILNALVLRALPVRQPERLVQLTGAYRNGAKVPFSFPMFEEVERGQRVFSELFGWSGRAGFNVESGGTLFLSDVRAVTGKYYTGLGASPRIGRLIAPEDARSRVAVLGYGFWESRCGRDPAIVGKQIRVEGQPFTIIGVTQRWFTGMTPGAPPEITIPAAASALFSLESRSSLWVWVTGRLKDRISVGQARAQLESFWPEVLTATVPTQSAGPRRLSFLSMGLDLAPATTGINTALRSQFTGPLYVLMGIVALILLIACVNLASLSLARAAARLHEMSVRTALGASRWRVARQLLAESALAPAAGAFLGLVSAYWGSRLLVRLMSEGTSIPVVLDLRPDWRVLAFTAAAAMLTALLIGLAPAWRLSGEPASFLRGNGRNLSRGAGTLGRGLIVTQIALSLVLLLGAGLLVRTLKALRASDPGFQKAGVIGASLYPVPEGYRNMDMAGYRRQLLGSIAAVPGVVSAGFSGLPVPAGDNGWRETVSPVANPDLSLMATLLVVSPGFFKTLGIPLDSGRDFDWRDDERHPRVAIVDGSLAHRLLPSGGPIRFGVQPEFEDLEIVGVARNARLVDLRSANTPVVYVPCSQHARFCEQGNLFLRADRPAALARAVENEIRSLGREYATTVKTVEQAADEALVEERATALLSSFFGAVALLLAGIGLFGLMSYSVSRRTREIGIRMALGSDRRGILRLILREAVLVSLAGIAVGLPCAFAGARLIEHMLFGVSPGDPATAAAVSGVLLGVGACAGYLPARRAMRLNPMAALHDE